MKLVLCILELEVCHFLNLTIYQPIILIYLKNIIHDLCRALVYFSFKTLLLYFSLSDIDSFVYNYKT